MKRAVRSSSKSGWDGGSPSLPKLLGVVTSEPAEVPAPDPVDDHPTGQGRRVPDDPVRELLPAAPLPEGLRARPSRARRGTSGATIGPGFAGLPRRKTGRSRDTPGLVVEHGPGRDLCRRPGGRHRGRRVPWGRRTALVAFSALIRASRSAIGRVDTSSGHSFCLLRGRPHLLGVAESRSSRSTISARSPARVSSVSAIGLGMSGRSTSWVLAITPARA